MPRNLPWLQKGTTSSSSASRTKKAVAASKTEKRRAERSESASGDSVGDTANAPLKKKIALGRARAMFTSSPPEAPTENFMAEGMEYDDRYRMVEDEFLSVAQGFTIHLHAAEYKRQQERVKARKADDISSISRPVTGVMPDQTRRKVNSVAQAKAQDSAIQRMAEKNRAEQARDDNDSDDGIQLPYVGTTLHGLMDSPRRKTASLAHLGGVKVASRAAAGYHKPVCQPRGSQHRDSESPKSKAQIRLHESAKTKDDSSTDSDDEDDDFDLDKP